MAGGVGIRVRDARVELDDDWFDQLGHGTAAAATIRGHAPEAELYALRLFRRQLAVHVEALLAAIDWSIEEGLRLLNLSLGCTSFDWKETFEEATARAARAGLIIVTAGEVNGEPSLPGVLPETVAVGADPDLEDGELGYGQGLILAPPWPRQLPELPKERNFQGVSFAVSHVTGIAAKILSEMEDVDAGELVVHLRRYAMRK